jgi:hypothetical protein
VLKSLKKALQRCCKSAIVMTIVAIVRRAVAALAAAVAVASVVVAARAVRPVHRVVTKLAV